MGFPKTNWGDWKTEGIDEDQVHRFFERRMSLDWTDVAADAEVAIREITGTYIPDPYEQVIKGVAAQSWNGAFVLVGAMLGLDPRAIERVVEPWNNKEETPDPITFDEFLDLHRQAVQQMFDTRYGFNRVKSGS